MSWRLKRLYFHSGNEAQLCYHADVRNTFLRNVMPLAFDKIVDISLELDPQNFAMRTPAGFTRDLQFAMEVLKEHDAPGGAGQIVRGVHMRLHAGSHVDAPEHNVRGGTQIHQLPLGLFIGDAIIPDLRDKVPGKPITETDLEGAIGSCVRHGDRVLMRTDHNNSYDGGSDKWMKTSPYLTIGATRWLIAKGVVIVGYDLPRQ
jgi:kynurenine formamidase